MKADKPWWSIQVDGDTTHIEVRLPAKGTRGRDTIINTTITRGSKSRVVKRKRGKK
jgi:hypothetical protein